MSTMIFAFGFMLLMTAIMAVGVMAGRPPIAGTCGGMKALGLDTSCEICRGNPSLCDSADGSAPLDPATPVHAQELAQEAVSRREI